MVRIPLILGLLAAAYLTLRGKHTATRLALARIVITAILLLGILAVLSPAAVTTVANAMDVGRGTDLVLYVLAVAFLLTAAGLYRKLQDLNERYVELVRHLAILNATAAQTLPMESRDDEPQARARATTERA